MKRRKRSKTQAERLASLDWNINDAREALKNAVDMGDWNGVKKYTNQLEKLELKKLRATQLGWRRSNRQTMLYRHRTSEAGHLARERGKRGAP